MMDAPAADTLLEWRTRLNVIKARNSDLALRIRTGRSVEVAALKSKTMARAHRFRDTVELAPVRHAGSLAGRLDDPAAVAALAASLAQFGRAALAAVKAADRRQLDADIEAAQP